MDKIDSHNDSSTCARNGSVTSAPGDQPKRSNSWERQNAIVYDVSTQTLTKEQRKKVGGFHTRIAIPKRPKRSIKDNVRISVPLGFKSEEEFLAELKLNSLGYKVAFERYFGNIEEIWIKGVPSTVR